jgi:hypothetical protein
MNLLHLLWLVCKYVHEAHRVQAVRTQIREGLILSAGRHNSCHAMASEENPTTNESTHNYDRKGNLFLVPRKSKHPTGRPNKNCRVAPGEAESHHTHCQRQFRILEVVAAQELLLR